MVEQLNLALPKAEKWTPPKGKSACRRDPSAGPGTCYHWWEGCPKAEQRGCYFAWHREQNAAATEANND